VNVRFTQLLNRVRPKDQIGILRRLLPNRYSPLQQDGNGLQGIYLTELPDDLAEVLGGLIGLEFEAIRSTELVCSLIVAIPEAVQKRASGRWRERRSAAVPRFSKADFSPAAVQLPKLEKCFRL
jgi:hypothetical protein